MHRIVAIVSLAVGAALAAAGPAGAQPILSAGHHTPFKLARTPGGNFLLAESGTGADDGRVSLLSKWGDSFNLISGLPSAIQAEGSPIGPTGVADAHATIYVAIGEGNATAAAPPPTQAGNPTGPSSPIFSSLLRARFQPVPDAIRQGFELTAGDVQALADGLEVNLDNDRGEHVSLLLLADFRDLVPDPILVVRQSNPFAVAVAGSLSRQDLRELGFPHRAIAEANRFARLHPDTPLGRRLEERTTIYVVDAGMNTINAVAAATGRWRVLTRFPRLPNPLFPALGGPTMDPVPTGVRVRDDGDLLVSLLTGFPFPQGAARVVRVDGESGAWETVADGLTTATDVLELGGDLYVLEVSTNLLAQAPGRVVRLAGAGAVPAVVAGGLIGAAGFVHDPFRDELIVSEAFTGRVLRVGLGH